MVRQARAMIRDGDLGPVRQVQVEYIQGHNAVLREGERGEAPARWRFQPEKSGASLVLGDIGTHAHISPLSSVDGILRNSVPMSGRRCRGASPTTPAGILFRLDNGAPGAIWVTQASAGAVHGLKFRVSCETGSLQWFEETPNQLFCARHGAPALVFERGGPASNPKPRAPSASRSATRKASSRPLRRFIRMPPKRSPPASSASRPSSPRPRFPDRRRRRALDGVHRGRARLRALRRLGRGLSAYWATSAVKSLGPSVIDRPPSPAIFCRWSPGDL